MQRGLVAFTMLFFLLATTSLGGEGTGGSAGIAVGGAAPSFVAKDLGGDAVDLAELVRTRRSVVLNFWGLRCGACIEELPSLNRIYVERKAAGLAMLGINVDGIGPDMLKTQVAKMTQAPVFPVVADAELKVADLYGLGGAPLTVLIDRGGKIAYIHQGYTTGDEKELEERIAETLR